MRKGACSGNFLPSCYQCAGVAMMLPDCLRVYHGRVPCLVLLLPPVKRSPHLFWQGYFGIFRAHTRATPQPSTIDNQSFVVVDLFLPSLSCCAWIELLESPVFAVDIIVHHLFASNVLSPSYSRRLGHGLTKRTTGKIMLGDAPGSKKRAAD